MVYFWLINLVLILVSPMSYAQITLNRTLSLTPPAGDVSMVYLAELFGSVEGVLGGSGSQLFGQMMSIFNGAILALGSIFVFYTIIVGTLNTAHEGEFLGRQWSSIWLPVRSVLGVSILSPGVSGFSLIQVFVMWVIVQGVGAADKIWYSALDYLNTGGTLYKSEKSFTTSQKMQESTSTQGNPIYKGAATILTGQVCMLTLQKLLEQLRKQIVNYPSSPCKASPVNNTWAPICFNNIPDFLITFNPVEIQNNATSQYLTTGRAVDKLTLPMPNISTSDPLYSIFSLLNGLCGVVSWKNLTSDTALTGNKGNLIRNGINGAQFETMLNARAIAIQSMFDFLEPTARAMVANSPIISNDKSDGTNCMIKLTLNGSPSCFAKQQYGYAYKNSGSICNQRSSDCTLWTSQIDPTASSSMTSLLTGQEFSNALKAYDGVMLPILTLKQQLSDMGNFDKTRNFIFNAKSYGWIMAGTYFFELIRISGSPVPDYNLTDKNSGLEDSIIYTSSTKKLPTDCSNNNTGVCLMVNQLKPAFDINRFGLLDLIIIGASPSFPTMSICSNFNGFNFGDFNTNTGYIRPNDKLTAIPECSTNVYSYLGNSFFLFIPGSSLPPVVIDMPNLDNPGAYPPRSSLPSNYIPCGGIKILWWKICILRPVLYGLMWPILVIFDTLQSIVNEIIPYVWYSCVIVPLQSWLFPTLFSFLAKFNEVAVFNEQNPIVALGTLGAFLIQETIKIYWSLAGLIFMGTIPLLGAVVKIILSFTLPLFFSWLALFMYIGITISYYIPMLPYIIFLFGSIGWFMAVMESMVAAPILALGVMSPEGEGLSGKSERGFLILVNVFLRPSMMIVGYVISIALSFVAVHLLIMGYSRGAVILNTETGYAGVDWSGYLMTRAFAKGFSIFIVINLYTAIVQKCFTLIFILPDRVMRWIGGGPESYGADTEKWLDEMKNSVEKFAETTDKGMAAGTQKLMTQLGSVAADIAKSVATKGKKGKGGGDVSGGGS